MKTIIKDAKTTIIEAYSELDKLFDSRLSKYKTYAGKDLVLGIKGADDKKTCHMDIQREVFIEGNYDKAKFEIHDLLKDAEKLVSKYEGMEISDGETKYIGQKPVINCDYNHIKTQFNIFILFKEIDDINEDIEDVWYNDDWTQEDEEDFNTYEEDDPITPEQEAFAKEIRSFLQSLIDKEEQNDDELEEKFTSQQSLINHFNRHCLANTPNRKSTKSNVYYDFTSVKQYSNYEQKLYNIFRQGVSNSKERYDFIDDIFDVNDVNRKFTKLFEGNFTLFISGIFGLRNSKGTVNLGIHAFSSDVTTNYTEGNTLDICILTSSPKTITLYPVDAATIKKEIVRIINKYSQLSLTPSKDDKKLLDNLNEREDEDLKETSPYTNIKSNGIYSLNTGWVKHPVQQDIPDIDMDEFEKEFKVWEDKYFDLLDKENSKEEIDNLIEDIYNLRQEGMKEENGEYSIPNLIFKEFRNLGYLDNLKELRKKEIDKELSLENLNNDNQLTEDVGDVLEDQKESYLISSGNYVLVASIKNKKLTPSWVTSQSITKYNQIRFLSADDAQKFNDKYNLNGNVGKAHSSYDLIEINLDPTIKTYINKAWFSKMGSNTLKSAGLQDIKLYSEDILNDLKEIFNIFDSKKTKFDLNGIIIRVAKNYSVPIKVENTSQLEKNKNKLIDVEDINLNLRYILKNIALYLSIYINNKDNRLNAIDRVILRAEQKDISISGSEEEIKNETTSIPNISTIIDIGNFLLKEIRKDVDYRNHVQELKTLGIKSLENAYENWNGKIFNFENFYFDIDFENNIWAVESQFYSNCSLKLKKSSPKEYYMTYTLGSRDDLYGSNGLISKVDKAEDELNKEIKNSNLNLIESLNKISAYWEKEDNNIDRNKVYEGINKYTYDIGQNLLDLAEANLKWLGE